jgi:hypothetical protein
VESVKSVAPRHGKSLAYGRLIALRSGEVVVSFPADAAFHRLTVTGAAGRATVEKALAAHFGLPTRIIEESAAAPTLPPSLAEEEARDRAVRERDIEQKVRAHPAVRSTLRLLGGEIEHVQVLEEEPPSAPVAEPADERS